MIYCIICLEDCEIYIPGTSCSFTIHSYFMSKSSNLKIKNEFILYREVDKRYEAYEFYKREGLLSIYE